MYIRETFRTPRAFVSPTVCSTSAAVVRVLSASTFFSTAPNSDFVKNSEVTFQCLAGDIHISTLTTAPTTASWKMIAGQALDLNVKDYLSMVSTSTGATFQVILWE